MIKELKKCLTSFGYRDLGDDKTFAKPLAYFIITAKINEDENEIVFNTLFKKHSDENEILCYNSKIAYFNSNEELNHNDIVLVFNDYEELSRQIASLELELIGSGGVITCGMNHKPWNFLTKVESVSFML